MLTDIFATRYDERPIWTEVGERERTLLVQMWRILKEQLMPYHTPQNKVNELFLPLWKDTESRVSMELGVKSLHPQVYGYYTANKTWVSGSYTLDFQCEQWMTAALTDEKQADRHMKQRVSFVELAFRNREALLNKQSAEAESSVRTAHAREALNAKRHGIVVTGSFAGMLKSAHDNQIKIWESCCEELNTRFRQAKVPLSYHNGFVQIAKDERIEEQIAEPFWALVRDPIWANVDTDMKEAVDRQESNDRDPAFYAVRALESAIKIVSDRKGWTTGNEKGAHAFIDNLVSAKNGRFVEVWEADAMKLIFTNIRNPLGHGPGSAEMPKLSDTQTDWTIEAAMSWTKSLVMRM